MDLIQASILLCFLMVALAHHGRKSYRQGREDGTNQGIEMALTVLQTKGIITLNEAEEILRVK